MRRHLAGCAICATVIGCFAVWTHLACADQPLPLEGQIGFFERRVAARPNDYLSRGILGRLYLRSARETGNGERYDDAEDTFRSALTINPRDPGSQLGLAECLMAQHRFHEGLVLAQAVHEKRPEMLEALATIGDAHLELGQYDEAEAAFAKLHKALPTAPVLARQARLLEIRGKQQPAIDLLQKALTQARDAGATPSEQAWYQDRLGELELQRGKLEVAALRFEEALAGDPLHPTALPSLALVRALQNQYDESEKLYNKALAHRASESLLIALGDVHQAQGETVEAQQLYSLGQSHLEHAVGVEESKPEEKPARKREGDAPAESKSKIDYEKLYRDIPHSHSHRYEEAHQRQLSLFYSEHELRPAKALELARRELKVRQDVYTHDALAWALYRNGDFEAAARASDEALKLGTRDAKLWFHAGMIQHQLGNREQALKHLTNVAELNPNFSLLDRTIAKATLHKLQAQQ